MPTVNIPAVLRTLTNGETSATVDGSTLGEVINQLDARYPGIKARLVEDGKLRGGIAVFVNEELPTTGLRTRLEPDAQIYFAPAIAGGT